MSKNKYTTEEFIEHLEDCIKKVSKELNAIVVDRMIHDYALSQNKNVVVSDEMKKCMDITDTYIRSSQYSLRDANYWFDKVVKEYNDLKNKEDKN